MRWNNDTDNLQPGDQLTLFVKTTVCRTPDSSINIKALVSPVPFYLCRFMRLNHNRVTGERPVLL